SVWVHLPGILEVPQGKIPLRSPESLAIGVIFPFANGFIVLDVPHRQVNPLPLEHEPAPWLPAAHGHSGVEWIGQRKRVERLARIDAPRLVNIEERSYLIGAEQSHQILIERAVAVNKQVCTSHEDTLSRSEADGRSLVVCQRSQVK